MHKVFISYHHENDQVYKEKLLYLNSVYKIFIDYSVDTRDIPDGLHDLVIREKIRDEYLRESTVTIVLVGIETKKRKHVDWEIYSSMYDGQRNKKSGILVINLPQINCNYFKAAHEGEKEMVYSYIDKDSWITIDDRIEFERRYPYMPDRIIDNLLKNDVQISVIGWEKIENDPDTLSFLIDATSNDRTKCNYHLSRQMRRANS